MAKTLVAFRRTDTGLLAENFTLTVWAKDDPGGEITINAWSWTEQGLGMYFIDAPDVVIPATFSVTDGVAAPNETYAEGEFDTLAQELIAAGVAPTAQEIRDAMKLAPSSGDPDNLSIDHRLDGIRALCRVPIRTYYVTPSNWELAVGQNYKDIQATFTGTVQDPSGKLQLWAFNPYFDTEILLGEFDATQAFTPIDMIGPVGDDHILRVKCVANDGHETGFTAGVLSITPNQVTLEPVSMYDQTLPLRWNLPASVGGAFYDLMRDGNISMGMTQVGAEVLAYDQHGDGRTVEHLLQEAAQNDARMPCGGWTEMATITPSAAVPTLVDIKIYSHHGQTAQNIIASKPSGNAAWANMSANFPIPYASVMRIKIDCTQAAMPTMNIRLYPTRSATYAGFEFRPSFALFVPAIPLGEILDAWIMRDGTLLYDQEDLYTPNLRSGAVESESGIIEAITRSSIHVWSHRMTKYVSCTAPAGTFPVVVVVEGASRLIRDDGDLGLFRSSEALVQGYANLLEDASLPGSFTYSMVDENWNDGTYLAYLYADSNMAATPISSVVLQVHSNAIQVVSTGIMRKLRNIEVRK